MAFEKVVPEWLAEGIEPPQSLKESGFAAGYKPPADYFNWYMRGTSEALKELQENAGLATVYVTLSGNADDGYSVDKTFAEIMAAYNAGNQLILIEHAYGSIVEYKLQYVYSDQIDFSYHKAINHTVIEVYSHGVVTRKNYQYFSNINPPRYDDVGAEPLGAVHNHNTAENAHDGILVPTTRKVNGKALSADVNLTNSDVGAAPAGYGLGGSAKVLSSADDLNTIWQNGNYSWGESAPANAPVISWDARYGYMRVYNSSPSNFTQTIYSTYAGSEGVAIVRTCKDGVFTPVEWVNPPMKLGVEYRTTERIGGVAVYKKNDGGVIKYRLDGETEWKPYAKAVGGIASADKPSGAYTGNGSASRDPIDTGGIGDAIRISSSHGTVLAFPGGAITQFGQTISGLWADAVVFQDGKLTIRTDSNFVNANGVSYYYQVL